MYENFILKIMERREILDVDPESLNLLLPETFDQLTKRNIKR